MTLSGIIKTFSARALLLAIGTASAALLGVALVAQYGFGLQPCELCMAQRYPYALIIILGFSGAIFIKTERTARILVWLCVLLLFTDAAIAIYHAGVEWKIFPGPTACSSTASEGETLEDVRRAIMNAPLVPCNQPAAYIWGLSLAAWNAIAATLLTVASALYLRKSA